ncbi:MAG: PilT/PilU family type 4a pilus ATPase [Myxococcales bacterium]|nr:PilT/PilU family type 4a pilus ATPase [Myxococcales bacterium]
MRDWNSSDMHLSVGRPPMFRVNGKLDAIRYRALTDGDFRTLVEPITPPHLWKQYVETGDVDFAFEMPGISRFRVNLFRQERGMGGVFRNLAASLVTLKKLNLPESIEKIVEFKQGLVLVTGPTGSGKSTSLAAIINEINQRRPCHIITIEDPIEFVHANKAALVSQREIGAHAESFAAALRAALRENPDIVLVGEMRDLETVSMALTAAETGILVFGTLHTNSAAKTVDRLVGVFPTERQPGVRNTLSATLKAVVAQQLLPKKAGGRIAAIEILFGTSGLSAMIREGKTHQIPGVIAQGKGLGMIGMDETLQRFVEQEIVSWEDALEKAVDKDAFREWLNAKGVAAED